MEPFVVDAALDGTTGQVVYKTEPKVLHKLPLSETNRQAIANGMRAVVTVGTSKLAALPGIAVAGKSGSAEVFKGSKTHGWFTCYAPFESPKIAICVFLESDGRTVAITAGPSARRWRRKSWRRTSHRRRR
jgi:peptidoglycan glycosyltransferase